MALNKLMVSALRFLSYAEPDVSQNYKLDRALREIVSAPTINAFNIWDQKVSVGGAEIPVRIFQPAEQKSRELIVYFHGGGWVVGSIDTYTRACGMIADTMGRRVMSVDYRLAPEYPFPCAPEDCYAVTKSIFEHASDFGADTHNIILMGDSAGGNLAAAVSLMAEKRGEFRVSRQVLIYPSTAPDHTEGSPFASIRENGAGYLLTSKRVCEYISLYLTDPSDYSDYRYAPILADSCKGQPKTLILTAQYDPLRDEGEAYAKKLQADGVDCKYFRIPDALHGFITLPKSFEVVRVAYERIQSFISEPFEKADNET